jgi:hypothetical protein
LQLPPPPRHRRRTSPVAASTPSPSSHVTRCRLHPITVVTRRHLLAASGGARPIAGGGVVSRGGTWLWEGESRRVARRGGRI